MKIRHYPKPYQTRYSRNLSHRRIRPRIGLPLLALWLIPACNTTKQQVQTDSATTVEAVKPEFDYYPEMDRLTVFLNDPTAKGLVKVTGIKDASPLHLAVIRDNKDSLRELLAEYKFRPNLIATVRFSNNQQSLVTPYDLATFLPTRGAMEILEEYTGQNIEKAVQTESFKTFNPPKDLYK